MPLAHRTVALYGRFSAGARARFAAAVTAAGGAVARDLTRRCDALVVGAQALPLLESGALARRLEQAHARAAAIFGERRFAAYLAGAAEAPASYPLAVALAQCGLSEADALALAAFDLLQLEGAQCSFADAQTLRAAGELAAAGRSLGQIVRALCELRDAAPGGRRRLVAAPGGAALAWEDGLSTLSGQGLLPLAGESPELEDLFEAAAAAEADGDFALAERLYARCARLDRKDPAAPYNQANALFALARFQEAALAYQQALARDPELAEARYNRAQALEALGRAGEAADELQAALASEPTYAEALFNLAQLRFAAGRLGEARALYERFLAAGPAPEWAAKARRALAYCAGAPR